MFLIRFLIRTSAFIGKEISEILRQPRLILTLVLGPFLILFLFGIGYQNQARALRTLFVVPAGGDAAAMTQQIQQYATSLGPQLVFKGTTADENAARQALIQRQVDLVVLTPANAFETIRQNKQAPFILLHNEIDPQQVDYISYFGQVYVAEVNRRVLLSMIQQGQADTVKAQGDVQQARTNVAAVRSALQAGDQATAQQQQKALSQNIDALDLALGATAGFMGGIQGSDPAANATAATDTQSGQASSGNLSTALQSIRQDNNALAAGQGGIDAQTQRAARLEDELRRLDGELNDFRNVDPNVLVQPFTSKGQSVASVQPTISAYFTPAVIALLLQHLAITFAALSIVRERQLGAMELFRISPVSAFETLLGKYISYMVFGSFLAAILSLLVVYLLKVPLLGDPRWYAAVLAALLFTSLGVGFFMSLVANTDSQAVQYAMIMLLSSVFFSGFLLSIDNLTQPVRLVSWLIPATYGINLLQNIMLRGYLLQSWMLSLLIAFGVALFIVSWAMLHRRMARN